MVTFKAFRFIGRKNTITAHLDEILLIDDLMKSIKWGFVDLSKEWGVGRCWL